MKKLVETAAGVTRQNKSLMVRSFLALGVVFLTLPVRADDAFTAGATAPSVTTMANTATGIAYGVLGVAVAIVGVKLGIRFVKWIRG